MQAAMVEIEEEILALTRMKSLVHTYTVMYRSVEKVQSGKKTSLIN